jgi:hypothetical protein
MATFPNPENVSDTIGLFQYGNTVTGELFMPIILIVIWFILYIALKEWGPESAMSSSLFIIMILAIVMRAGALVTDLVVTVAIIAFLAAAAWAIFKKGS